MARKKERAQGIAVHSEEDAIKLARKHAFWEHVPAAYQMEQGEAMDPQEQLDALSKQDKCDRDAFKNGCMEKCCIGQRIEKEELEEELAKFHS